MIPRCCSRRLPRCAVYAVLGLLSQLGVTTATQAASISLGIGPEIVDNGGSYPQFLPPGDPGQYTLTFVTDGNLEFDISEFPGLLLGYRFNAQGLYVSIGGGGLLDVRGAGLGVYSSFGYESGGGTKGWHFFSSFTQTLGMTHGAYMAPSALRLGAIWEY